MAAQKKALLLRLDDGTLIGPTSVLGAASEASSAAARGTAMKLTVDKAVRVLPPRAGESDIARLRRLIASLQKELPADAIAQYHQEQDSKRARLSAPPITAAEYSKCSKILQAVYSFLGPIDKVIFYSPVDRRLFTDYYDIVKNPICLKELEEKLKYKKYKTAQEFADDMYLVWSNCFLYNPEGDSVRKLGEKARDVFETQWLSSGMCLESRGKRATAGIAAPKYEPEVFEPPSVPKTSGATKGGGKRAAGEASSGGQGTRPLTDQHRQDIADQLGALPEEHMDGLMQLLPPEMLEGADGEFELDFNALQDATLWKIDAFLKQINGNAGDSQPMLGGQAGLRLDPDTSGGAEDDDDSDEDSG